MPEDIKSNSPPKSSKSTPREFFARIYGDLDRTGEEIRAEETEKISPVSTSVTLETRPNLLRYEEPKDIRDVLKNARPLVEREKFGQCSNPLVFVRKNVEESAFLREPQILPVQFLEAGFPPFLPLDKNLPRYPHMRKKYF